MGVCHCVVTQRHTERDTADTRNTAACAAVRQTTTFNAHNTNTALTTPSVRLHTAQQKNALNRRRHNQSIKSHGHKNTQTKQETETERAETSERTCRRPHTHFHRTIFGANTATLCAHMHGQQITRKKRQNVTACSPKRRPKSGCTPEGV